MFVLFKDISATLNRKEEPSYIRVLFVHQVHGLNVIKLNERQKDRKRI